MKQNQIIKYHIEKATVDFDAEHKSFISGWYPLKTITIEQKDAENTEKLFDALDLDAEAIDLEIDYDAYFGSIETADLCFKAYVNYADNRDAECYEFTLANV